MRRVLKFLSSFAAIGLLLPAVADAGPIKAPEPTAGHLLASGLQGTTGATIGPDGALYVAEGKVGRITRIDQNSGKASTFASGFPVAVAPIGGVIDEVFAEAGEHIAPGARIALAHETDGLWMEAHIKETDLPRISIGAAVEMRFDATRAACHGEVERIGEAATSEFALLPNANPAGVFTKITQRVPVRIRIGADCEAVRPGAMATLRIRAA